MKISLAILSIKLHAHCIEAKQKFAKNLPTTQTNASTGQPSVKSSYYNITVSSVDPTTAYVFVFDCQYHNDCFVV